MISDRRSSGSAALQTGFFIVSETESSTFERISLRLWEDDDPGVVSCRLPVQRRVELHSRTQENLTFDSLYYFPSYTPLRRVFKHQYNLSQFTEVRSAFDYQNVLVFFSPEDFLIEIIAFP